MNPPERVRATPAALALIERLRGQHGAISFYLSHGCCDGSAPMCFAPGEMPLSADDRLLGWLPVAPAAVPFHVSVTQAEYLAGLEITLDVAAGDSGTFSLEDGSGQRFVARYRLWRDDEAEALAQAPGLLPSHQAPAEGPVVTPAPPAR